MASVKICDICKGICDLPKRYELIERGIFKDYSYDICTDCMNRIKKEIKERSR